MTAAAAAGTAEADDDIDNDKMTSSVAPAEMRSTDVIGQTYCYSLHSQHRAMPGCQGSHHVYTYPCTCTYTYLVNVNSFGGNNSPATTCLQVSHCQVTYCTITTPFQDSVTSSCNIILICIAEAATMTFRTC